MSISICCTRALHTVIISPIAPHSIKEISYVLENKVVK
jgi:hypothetical protein